jgi:hypothetical protein
MAKIKIRTVSRAKKDAWDAFSKYIRLRDCLMTTGTIEEGHCVTCNRKKSFKKLQAGHFMPGRRNEILIDEKTVNAQCYACNIMKNGNWTEYYKFMVRRFGIVMVNEYIHRPKKTLQLRNYEWDAIRDKYQDKYNKLLIKAGGQNESFQKETSGQSASSANRPAKTKVN